MKSFAAKKVVAVVLSALALQACTKAREPKFAYGAGEDLLSISDFDGKEFTLTTGAEISALNTTAGQSVKNIEIGLQQFNVVSYSTDATLLDSAPFVGKPSTTYKIRYELSDQFLKVVKVAKKSDLSLSELTYAEATGSGSDLMKVPLIGYPVLYTKVTKGRNDYNEETSKLTELPKQSKAEATHFRLVRGGKTIFKALQKVDTFPVSFFEGDWYYAETIVSSNYNTKNNYGGYLSYDDFGNAASKVRFKKSNNSLQFYSLNIDENLLSTLDSRDENKANVVVIPADFKDYKIADYGADKGLNEEEDSDRPTLSRKYVKLYLSNVIDLFSKDGGGGLNEVSDIQVSGNYFSFTTVSKRTYIKVRHSFSKFGPRNYTPKKYFAADQTTFGYFKTKTNFLKERPDLYAEKDFDQFNFVNRFNPKLKEIKFYLSTNSPDWSRPIAEEAVSRWNKAFAEAGSSTSIILGEGKVDLGDIRYNVLNLLDIPDDQFQWGGFGPTVTDTSTGEIIASTANVNLNDDVNFIVSIIRRMADAKQGKLDIKYLFGEALTPTIPVSPEDLTTESGTKLRKLSFDAASFSKLAFAIQNPLKDEIISFNIPTYKGKEQTGQSVQKNLKVSYGLELDKLTPLAKTPTLVQLKSSKKSALTSAFNQVAERDLMGSYGNIVQDVNSSCPKVVAYIDGLSATSQRASTKDEFNLFKECSRIVAPKMIVSVLEHEMGHNFGLRHNFYGSVDKANWLEGETSSVMEYTVPNAKRGLGKYDIAAIRWGYVDKVETDSGEIVAVDPNLTIGENLAATSKIAKKFKYCTDENVDVVNVDPMCARTDYGTTPLEVVESLINNYETSLASTSQRLGRSSLDTERYAAGRLQGFMVPLKQYYDYFRLKVAEFARLENGYLENYSAEEYSALLKRMETDSRYKDVYAEYAPAAEKVRVFFKNLAFLPNRYCVAERSLATGIPEALGLANNYRAYALGDLRNEIYQAKAVIVNSCNDPATLEYLTTKNAKLIGDGTKAEVGFFLKDQFAELDPSKSISIRRVWDEDGSGGFAVPEAGGSFMDRFFAFMLISKRFPTSYLSHSQSFYPNMMDEPAFRAEMEDAVISRIVDGLDLSFLKSTSILETLKSGLKDNLKSKRIVSRNFADEHELLEAAFQFMVAGEAVPNRPQATIKRFERFMPQFTYGRISDEEAKAVNAVVLKGFGSSRVAFKEANPIAYRIISQINRNRGFLDAYDSSTTPDPALTEDIKAALVKNLPTLEKIKTDKLSAQDFFAAVNAAQEQVATKYANSGAFNNKIIEAYFQIYIGSLQNLLKVLVKTYEVSSSDFTKPLIRMKLATDKTNVVGDPVLIKAGDNLLSAFTSAPALNTLEKFTQEIVPSLILDQDSKKKAAAVEREELAAQAEMLTNTMNMF